MTEIIHTEAEAKAALKRDAVLNRDLDAAGCWAEPVDLVELEKLT
jgi:hypothetical protein